MIVVTGSVHAKAGALDQVLAASLEHVHRSRTEPGCLLHSVHQSVEDPSLVVFLEHWQDRNALKTHFAQPGSTAFVAAVRDLADQRPTLDIYEVTPINL